MGSESLGTHGLSCRKRKVACEPAAEAVDGLYLQGLQRAPKTGRRPDQAGQARRAGRVCAVEGVRQRAGCVGPERAAVPASGSLWASDPWLLCSGGVGIMCGAWVGA